jgi:transposase
MAGGYEKAVSKACPNAKTIYDRSRVQRLAAQAVSEVWRDALREIRGRPDGKELLALAGPAYSSLPGPATSPRHVESSRRLVRFGTGER